MTVQDVTRQTPYVGDGIEDTFPFDWRADDVAWVHGSEAGIEDLGIIVTLNANQDISPGGSVLFPSAPADLAVVSIYSDILPTQETSYPPRQPFPSKSHELALDKLTMIAQDNEQTPPETDVSGQVTYENLNVNGDIGDQASQVPDGGDVKSRTDANATLAQQGVDDAASADANADGRSLSSHTHAGLAVLSYGAFNANKTGGLTSDGAWHNFAGLNIGGDQTPAFGTVTTFPAVASMSLGTGFWLITYGATLQYTGADAEIKIRLFDDFFLSPYANTEIVQFSRSGATATSMMSGTAILDVGAGDIAVQYWFDNAITNAGLKSLYMTAQKLR